MRAEIYATNADKLAEENGIEILKGLGIDWNPDDCCAVKDMSMDDIHAIVRAFRHVVVTYSDEPSGCHNVQLTIEIYNDYRE